MTMREGTYNAECGSSDGAAAFCIVCSVIPVETGHARHSLASLNPGSHFLPDFMTFDQAVLRRVRILLPLSHLLLCVFLQIKTMIDEEYSV